jgi:hypothetical protein
MLNEQTVPDLDRGGKLPAFHGGHRFLAPAGRPLWPRTPAGPARITGSRLKYRSRWDAETRRRGVGERCTIGFGRG